MNYIDGSGRLLLVGESPGSNPPDKPLSAAQPSWTGRRLARILSMTPEYYEGATIRTNLSNVPGEVPTVQSVTTAVRLSIWHRSCHRATVFLGERVANAVLKGEPWEWFTPSHTGSPFQSPSCYKYRFVVIPHPSGTNRVYNDPEVKRAAREAVWRELAHAAYRRRQAAKPAGAKVHVEFDPVAALAHAPQAKNIFSAFQTHELSKVIAKQKRIG